ncbi:MAG: ATP-binding protein [Algisphaera sp.]
MLINFTVANFKSFSEKQDFTMEADTGVSELPGNLVQPEPRNFQYIKTAVIYGSNASGKTNLIKAMNVVKRNVLRSKRTDEYDAVDRVDPFRLDEDLRDGPTEFEFEVLLGEDRYRYTLHATRDRVIYEHFEHTMESRHSWATVFERPSAESDEITQFGNKYAKKTQQDQVNDTTTATRLMLGAASAANIKHASKLSQWFNSGLAYYDFHRNSRAEEELHRSLGRWLPRNESSEVVQFMKLARQADVGISGVIFESEMPRDPDARQMDLLVGQLDDPNHPARRIADEEEDVLLQYKKWQQWVGELKQETYQSRHAGLRFTHRNEKTGEDIDFALSQESSGTRRFFTLLYLLFRGNEKGQSQTLLIDEFGSSLTPELTHRLIRMAQSPEINRSGTQLIFTTHDRSLLDEPNLLRRDQVWITQKELHGGTDLYRLSDFSAEDIRKDRPWGRQFATGKFGGVPEFGPELDVIPLPTEPQVLPLFEEIRHGKK